MKNKEKYKKFCDTHPIPIFSQYWWLDSVCVGGEWDIILIEKGGQVVASMPYFLKKKGPFRSITMPLLTQTMGPYITYPNAQKYESKIAYEKKVMLELISNLPKVNRFNQNFHYSINNWLPFFWKGFNQTTRYTYTIENDTLDNIFSTFSSNMKNKIRKASKIINVFDGSINDMYSLSVKTFERQNLNVPFSLKYLKEMDSVCQKNNCRKIFLAQDNLNNKHSCLYLIWDKQSSYVHLVGEDPEFRNSGAGIFLIYEAIKFTFEKLKLKTFDFEGSMIESVEQVRRSCGGVQTPYFNITKNNSFISRIFKKAIQFL